MPVAVPGDATAGLAHGEPDVDEQVEVDLVAAEASRHEGAEHARGLERLDHVVVGLAPPLGVEGVRPERLGCVG